MWLCYALFTLYLPPDPLVPRVFLMLFALAPTVLVGLVLRVVVLFPADAPPAWRSVEGYLLRAESGCALAALASLLLPPGPYAAACAVLWLLLTLAIAVLGALRLLYFGLRRPEELVINFGLCFVAVGGIWLVIARAGLNPMSFGHAIVFLTAVHFHFAGLASCIILGLSGRLILPDVPLWGHVLYFSAVIAAILGIPLLALGI